MRGKLVAGVSGSWQEIRGCADAGVGRCGRGCADVLFENAEAGTNPLFMV
jgi:hypothetical protein